MTVIEIENILESYGVENPTTRNLIANKILDRFEEEMIDGR